MRYTATLLALILTISLAATACGDDYRSGGGVSVTPTTSPIADPGPCLPNLDSAPPEGGLTWTDILPAEIPAPEGWSVQPAEGEGPFLTVSDEERAVGTVELLAFPLTTLTDPPFDPQRGLAALQDWALDVYRTTREDRELVFGEEYVFEQDEPEPADAGQFCAVRYSFKGTLDGVVQDRVAGYATYDSENLYLFSVSYDAANASEGIGFLDPESLEEYAPSLDALAVSLRFPPP